VVAGEVEAAVVVAAILHPEWVRDADLAAVGGAATPTLSATAAAAAARQPGQHRTLQ
jgi:hypothetical protein